MNSKTLINIATPGDKNKKGGLLMGHILCQLIRGFMLQHGPVSATNLAHLIKEPIENISNILASSDFTSETIGQAELFYPANHTAPITP